MSRHPSAPHPADPHSLYASGFYGRALNILEKSSAQRALSVEEKVLRTQLLERTGAVKKAILAGQELLKERGLTVTDGCKLRHALGHSYFVIGRHGLGTEEYEHGIRLAETHGAHVAACNLRISMFRDRIRWIGPYHATSEVNQLRRQVHRAADPVLSTKFQMYLVELAAKLGLFRKARRHLSIAQELLATVDDHALMVNVGLTEAALTAQQGDLGRALELSLKLVDSVNRTGDASASLAIATNLGHLLIAQTRHSDALRWLHEELEAQRHRGGHGGGPEVALRDTLMLLHVSRGDLDEANSEAARIQSLLRDSHDSISFYGLWHVVTRV
ncbi:MAG TPA: hypothetical protein VFR18_16510, partial [Terriglobia bacterium]|nr:hypothetical protein [Terriglobia bacterium]